MELLGSRMLFGTAGLRAKMGAGYSQMNDLTVIQTAQVYTYHTTGIYLPYNSHTSIVHCVARTCQLPILYIIVFVFSCFI